jgi:hypothetical protein
MYLSINIFSLFEIWFEICKGPPKKKKQAASCSTENIIHQWLHPRWYSHTMRQWTKLHTRKGRNHLLLQVPRKVRGQLPQLLLLLVDLAGNCLSIFFNIIFVIYCWLCFIKLIYRSGHRSNDPMAIQVSTSTALWRVHTEPLEVVLPQSTPKKKMTVKKKLTPKKLQIAAASTTLLCLLCSDVCLYWCSFADVMHQKQVLYFSILLC